MFLTSSAPYKVRKINFFLGLQICIHPLTIYITIFPTNLSSSHGRRQRKGGRQAYDPVSLIQNLKKKEGNIHNISKNK
jgi:hypothetical protein